ncbi:Aminotransferase, class iv, partial [Globisporangium polare]
QPKKKMQETEYFDEDDHEEEEEEEEDQDDADSSRGAKLSSTLKPGADRRVSNSNQAALAAHETGSRQERLKSGGNGAIARDNNFVEEDWDAEDEQEAAQAPVSKNAGDVIENPAKVSVGFGGVAADSNFVSEDWDD